MGIGDWGLGIGDCNPQSPIPNPQYILFILKTTTKLLLILIILINKNKYLSI